MNRKHKNKNKHNKPPNPVPPQKSVIEEIHESDPKVEDKAPEIIPDDPPVDISELEEEFVVPKKPKRKKDENKLEDKVGDDKTIETEENIKDNTKLEEKIEHGEISEIFTDKGSELENIAVPISRKKKGKNKKLIEPIEMKSKPDVVDDVSKKVNIEENINKEETKVLDSNLNLHNVTQSETSSSKKKNKNKKNKKDEEYTNKIEDTTLEQLNNSINISSKINQPEEIKDNKDLHLIAVSEVSNQSKESTVNESIDSEKPSHQRKNKKSKADKKHLVTSSKQETDIVKCENPENLLLNSTSEEMLKNDIPSVTVSKDLLKCITVSEKGTNINVEPIKVSKGKGTNMKPKDNLLCLEEELLVSADEVKSDTKDLKCVDQSNETDVFKSKQNLDKNSDQVSTPELNINQNTVAYISESRNISNKDNLLVNTDILSNYSKIDTLNPLQKDKTCQEVISENKDSDRKEIDGEISKCKRKNKKNKEHILSLQKDLVANVPDLKSEYLEIQSSDLVKENILTTNTASDCDVSKVEPIPETSCDTLLSALESKSTLESETLKCKKKNKKNKDHLITLQENTEACATNTNYTIDFLAEKSHVETEKNDKIEDNLIKERKNVKDKKHNIGKENETLTALNIVDDKLKQTESKEDIVRPQTSTIEVVDSSMYIQSEITSENVEIRSNKSNKTDMVTSNILPEQSETSQPINQQSIIDPNNNTVTELGNQTLTVPFNIPDTPLIVSSKTVKLDDILNLDKMNVQLSETKLAVSDKNIEKTDLKSKVMEVNKDMEELRISIEKSLAELTAMDKNEEIPELVSIVDVMVPKEMSIETQVIAKESMLESTQSDLITKSHVLLQDQPTIVTKMSPSTKMEDKGCSPNRDKGKGKSKKKGKKNVEIQSASPMATVPVSTETSDKSTEKDTSKSNKNGQKCDSSKESQSDNQQKNSSKQADDFENPSNDNNTDNDKDISCEVPKLSELSENESRRASLNSYYIVAEEDKQQFEPIEKFEDALTSSVDDINKSFELLSNQMIENIENKSTLETSKQEESVSKEKEKPQQKENPITHPKNLLGHPDIPVPSSRTDYKKEKNKTPNMQQAKVKIKDVIKDNIEKDNKRSQHSQTLNKPRVNGTEPSSSDRTLENEEYIYKYSFRKVYLPHTCHVCKKDLNEIRVPCNFCHILFYCSHKHKDEDWEQHQALCFAISTVAHLKGSKYIYGNSKNITGQAYRLLRMQAIVSCEKILKRRLVPWEQEALLYPRICGDTTCREWKQESLVDCDGCGQISYCKGNLDHFPKIHQRWCKSYALYQKMVLYQQTKGRLEPPLPTKVISNVDFELPDKINELLATLYEEKIDMDELQYAALTQVATAPLTAAYCHQVYLNKFNSTCANGIYKKSKFILHVVGAELQFEADSLNKWEIFFLHLKPELKELRVTLVGPELNPSNLPLDLLAKIKLCENCQMNKRKVIFSFHDKEFYHDFTKNLDFTVPDLVCAFNPSLNRTINDNEPWMSSLNAILKLKIPLCITGYTPEELPKDLSRIKQCAGIDFRVIAEPAYNPYGSVRSDRNFISDDEMPLLFKNYCYMILCGNI